MKNKLVIGAALCAAVAALSGCSGKAGGGFTIDPGNIGVITNHYSGSINGPYHAGWHAQVVGSGNELIELPTYSRTYTMVRGSTEGAHPGDDSVLVNTGSSNQLNVDVSIGYHLAYSDKTPPAVIKAFYTKYRSVFQTSDDHEFGDFEETQLRPAFRQAVNDAFGSNRTAYDLTSEGKRANAAYALKELQGRFSPDGISIDEVRIRAIYPDAATEAAMQSNLQAEQNLSLSTLNQQLNALENQKAVLAATADAQANHIRAASLTPRLVKFRHIKDIEITGVTPGAFVSQQPDTAPAADQAAAAPADPTPAQ